MWKWVFLLILTGCGDAIWETELPPSSELGTPRGLQISRTAVHVHSPYSHDACDGMGLENGTPNTTCLENFRFGVCENRVDFVMLTDHPTHMGEYGFQSLLLYEEGDTLLSSGGKPYANQIQCTNGHVATLQTGYEDRLMALAMNEHLSGSVNARTNRYREETATLVTDLKNDTDAVVIVPHTESRSLATLRTLGMDGIEIYNFHANVDPTIRRDYLGLDPYDGISKVLFQILDPFGIMQPDLTVLSLFEWPDTYRTTWNTLIDEGYQVTGIAANDSHENAAPIRARDQERFDSYRRTLRWFSNHYLVSSRTPAQIKSALRNGNGWFVFEAIGSPKDMDFSVDVSGTVSSVGETVTYAAGQTTLSVALPSVASKFRKREEEPQVKIVLKKVGSSGADQTVAESLNAPLSYAVPGTGNYRAEISLSLHHLKGYLPNDEYTENPEILWIVTNHIYIQ